MPAATVADWMTDAPTTVGPAEGLLTVRALFKRHRFRHVPVVGAGRLLGVVSDRDVLEAVSPFLDTPAETPRDVGTLTRTAADLMTRDVRTVGPGTPLADAARTMVEHDISSLPVVDAAGVLVGILTAKDVLRASTAVMAANA